MQLSPDAINGLLELGASTFISLSCLKLYRQKKVRGIHGLQVAYMTLWSLYFVYFYATLGTPWSFLGGVLTAGVSVVFTYMMARYTWLERAHRKSPAGYELTRDKTWCETWSGKQFFILDPDAAAVDVADIAHSLGNLCRYNGHTDGPRNGFYSVAEHCCLLSDYCLAQGWGPQRAFQALLHDAGEAYSGDIPRPWKCALPILKELEDHMDTIVLPVLGGPSVKPEWLDQIDARIVRDERTQARRPSKNHWPHDALEPLGVTILFWTPEQASAEWLRRFNDLSAC